MTRLQIAVAGSPFPEPTMHAIANRMGASLTFGPLDSPTAAADLSRGADALLVTLERIDSKTMAALDPSIRVISRAGVGLDTIDISAAAERDIRVVYQPSYATNEVAEHAMALLLASSRALLEADRSVRVGEWHVPQAGDRVRSLAASTLGVIGTGRIGRALIARMRPAVDQILAWDLAPDPDLDVTWCDGPDGVFEGSHLLSFHLPLTSETRHVLDARALARVRPGVTIVNVSRGGLIDEAALAEALQDGRVAAAGLDVFEGEPLAQDSPLRAAPNVLLTPHMAWYSAESAHRLCEWSIADAVHVVRTGQALKGSLA